MRDAVQPPPTSRLHGVDEVLLRLHLPRGLLWRGACDTAWVPLLLPPGSLYYVCASQHCPHTTVPAKILEQRVWSQFVRLQRGLTPQAPPAHQADLLCRSLRRVVIGEDSLELQLDCSTRTAPSRPPQGTCLS